MIDIFNQRTKFLHKKSNFLNADGIRSYIDVPDWNNLTCEEFPIEIQKFKDNWTEVYLKYAEAVGYSSEKGQLMTTEQTFFQNEEQEYLKEIENAQTIYDTKCTRTYIDEVVPRDIATKTESQTEPQAKTEVEPTIVRTPTPSYPTFTNKEDMSDGGGGGGEEKCACPNKELSNLGLILIGLGTLILVYNSK